MEKLFLSVLNMSITGAYVILAICLVRFLLKKAPKIISYILWGVAGFRLVIPFTIQSVVSLLPFKASPIPYDIGMQAVPRIDSGIAILNNTVSASLPVATPIASVNPLQVWIWIGSYIWLIGVGIMFFYSFLSIGLLKYGLRRAILIKDNLYEADNLKTPFVIGIFRPKIYIPIGLSNEERHYIILHEQTHIKRHDHLVKIFAYFVLCLHWYNPFVWLAFVLMGADMEMSCDEGVMKEMGAEIKKAYSLSLIRVAARHRILNGSPLAFGEGGMKERIKNILNFKKHSRVLIFAAIGLAAIVTVGFAVNKPLKDDNNDSEQSEINLIEGFPRIYRLEHPTDRQKIEKAVTIILYGDGRVGYSPILISSYLGPNNNSFTVDKELQTNQYVITIYEGIENIAHFKVIDDKTIELESASIPSFPEIGSRYVYMEEEEAATVSFSLTLMTFENLKEIAEEYKEDLTIDAFQGLAREYISKDMRSVQFYMYDRPYSLLVHLFEDGKIASAELFQVDGVSMGESIDIRYHDVAKFIEEGIKERTAELPSNLVIVPDFYPESLTGMYSGVVNGKDYQDIFNAAIKEKFGRSRVGFLVYVPTIHGAYEEEDTLRAFSTVYYLYYSLKENILTNEMGGVIPVSMTFKRENSSNDWILEEFIKIGATAEYPDGAAFLHSIRKACVLPVSGEEISGLADKIIEDYSEPSSSTMRNDTMKESLLYHLSKYNQKDIYLKLYDGSLEKLN